MERAWSTDSTFCIRFLTAIIANESWIFLQLGDFFSFSSFAQLTDMSFVIVWVCAKVVDIF